MGAYELQLIGFSVVWRGICRNILLIFILFFKILKLVSLCFLLLASKWSGNVPSFSEYYFGFLQRPHKETAIDPDRLASARKRLHENYQEAQNGNE